MSEIDSETLILALKKRPALYTKQDPNYNNRKYKIKLWTEVCKEVFPNYDNFKPQHKVEYGHELQRRWKSLRTCFTRELNCQRKEKLMKEKDEGPIKKRKRYEHFKRMSFLLDSMNAVDDQPNVTHVAEESDNTYESDDPLDNEGYENEITHQTTNVGNNSNFEIDPDISSLRPIYQRRNENLEDKILDMLKEIKKDEEDEDRQFMLSLVPSFRKLQPKEKFEARIEILRVLKDITFRESI